MSSFNERGLSEDSFGPSGGISVSAFDAFRMSTSPARRRTNSQRVYSQDQANVLDVDA